MLLEALVEKYCQETREVARARGNVQQASLDQQDKVNAHVASLRLEAQLVFRKLYTEELNAITGHTRRKLLRR